MFYQQDGSLVRSGDAGEGLVRESAGARDRPVSAQGSGGEPGSEGREHVSPAAQGRGAPSQRDAREGRRREQLSIVVVEDNEDSRDMLQMLLESRGHRVFAAKDGKEGADLIVERQPDLALVDIGLPTMNGYEVAKAVRAACPEARIYLVALTGYGRQEDRDAVMRAGFDEHIVKPIEPADLNRLAGKASGD